MKESIALLAQVATQEAVKPTTWATRLQWCLMAGVSAVFDGKAGKNGFTQGLEHEGGVRIELIYSDVKQTFSMAVTENFHSCLENIFNESVGITLSKANSVVNSS